MSSLSHSASKHIAGFKLSEMANNLHIVTLLKQGDIKGWSMEQHSAIVLCLNNNLIIIIMIALLHHNYVKKNQH